MPAIRDYYIRKY
jgi:hypothetical protein